MADYDHVVETYESYTAIQPYLPAIQNNLGLGYSKLGRFEEAESAYLSGLGIYEGDPVLVNNLAVLHKEHGQGERALALYRKYGAGTARAQHNLGLILAEREDHPAALSACRKALAMDPGFHEALYSLAGLHMVMGAFDSSAAGFEAFLRVWEGNPAYVRRAEGRLREIYPVLGDRGLAEGDWAGSLRAFNRLTDLGGASAKVLNNIALLHRKRGEPRKSLAACDRAVRTFPDSAEAYFTRGLLLDDSGDRAAAILAYRDFLERWPTLDRFHRHAAARVSELER